jgi:hypothetical protein
MIITRKSKNADKTGRPEFPDICRMCEGSDAYIVDDIGFIVKSKRGRETVGIEYGCPENENSDN